MSFSLLSNVAIALVYFLFGPFLKSEFLRTHISAQLHLNSADIALYRPLCSIIAIFLYQSNSADSIVS